MQIRDLDDRDRVVPGCHARSVGGQRPSEGVATLDPGDTGNA
jgi:hypothetical protein